MEVQKLCTSCRQLQSGFQMTVKNNNAAVLVFAFVGFLIGFKKWKVKYLTLRIGNSQDIGISITGKSS